MTSTNENIIVLNYESTYDLCLDFGGSYDLPIFPTPTNDVVVDGLTLRSNIYGDELEPCIMYLKTNAEVTPYVIILNNTILNQDDYLLTDLDPYLLSDIFKTNKENLRLALKTSCDISKISSIISPKPNSIKIAQERTISNFDGAPVTTLDQLRVNDNIELQTYINDLSADIGLSCSEVELMAVSYISITDAIAMKLTNEMRQNVLLTLFLTSTNHPLTSFDPYYLTDLDDRSLSQMDDISHIMRLSNSTISLDVEKYINGPAFNLKLKAIVEELYQTTKISINGTNIAHLSTRDIMLYTTKYLEDIRCDLPLITNRIDLIMNQKLKLKNANLPLVSGLDYKEFLMAYDDYYLEDLDDIDITRLDGADDCIHLKLSMEANHNIKLNADRLMLTLEPSAGAYDDTLLMDLDPYTLDNLEQEITNNTGTE